MEQQVRLHNKYFLFSFLMVALLDSCGHEPNLVPAIFFDVKDHSFVTRGNVTMADGKIFSGFQYSLYNNGDTAWLIPFFNGKEEGTVHSWYENGKLKSEGPFEDGKKIGEHNGWYMDGSIQFTRHYQNDVYEGEVKEWYPSGKVFKIFHYKDGQESGHQLQYFDNGSLQFNYDNINGRHYGLTGVKNCVNVSDSIGLQ